MNRKVALLIFILVVVMIGVLVYQIGHHIALNAEIQDRIQTLPDLDVFSDLRGKQFDMSSLAPRREVVIMHFHSDCVFCRSQVQDVLDHPELIARISWVLISAEKVDSLKVFEQKNHLEAYPAIFLLHDGQGRFPDLFGTGFFPVTYIYNSNTQLITNFKGQVRARAIYLAITAQEEAAEPQSESVTALKSRHRAPRVNMSAAD